MAQKPIEIPVNLKLELQQKSQDLKRVVDKVQEQFGDIDVGSALYKSATKGFGKIGSKMNLAEALLGKDFFTQGDFNKVISNLSSISDILSEITTQAANTQSYRILGLDTAELDASKESLKALKAEIVSIKNLKVGDIKGVGALTSQQLGKLNASSKKTGFSVNKSYGQNIDTMTNKLNEAQAALVTLENQAADTEKQLAKINAPALTIMKGLKNVSYNNQAEGFNSILDNQLTRNGHWKSGGKSVAQGLAQLIPDVAKKVSFDQPAAAIVQQLKDAFIEYVSQNKQNPFWESTKIAKNGTIEQQQVLQDQLLDPEKLAEVKNLQDQLSETEKKKIVLSQEITAHNELIEVLKKSRAAYETNIDKQNSSSVTEAEDKVKGATAKLEAEKLERQKNYIESGKESNNVQKGIYGVKALQDDNISLDREADRRAQEAENFKEHLKQSVRHWMSAQQIINIVKNGIRQAVQDIKGLDSAMSNIAVVTDMSISDLWGKINDYMAIAKQYGVTTQGVYEVSQLYYQQGLATAEVMDLTTETLKLARVANMDYKDSADAMTVALRGFKMEMSEAATVTDVYSKVAAITAADQAELATAMSKTASSAASVGSSFENTTAMLAVMVETTRESAQNLGSALKSIISRYGEMKSGLTQDSEGEVIDYNKVDIALRSIGISIKDAQGQFRDFDDVIFELSEAWDGLDKNTQRYIATIMAGNRQQSRFIALVDNYERLKEVSDAAAESEDAGLLQYAKTLDSLETKLNNIKTSFQQFYMNIINGPVIGKALDFINKIIEGFNRLGSLSGILSLGSIISGLKSLLSVVVALFSNSFSEIITNWRNMQQQWLNQARISGAERGKAEREAYENELDKSSGAPGKGSGNGLMIASTVASVAGGILSLVGNRLSSNSDTMKWGAGLNTAGAALTGASVGAMFGPIGIAVGALLGGIAGYLTNIVGLEQKILEAKRDEAKQAAEDANVKRAQSTSEYKNLQQYITKFKEVSEARNSSNEAYEEWINLNNEIAEKYPELISYIDAEGNSIVNLSDSYEGLALAKQKALMDTNAYWDKQLEYYEAELAYNKSTEINGAKEYTVKDTRDVLSIGDEDTYASRQTQGISLKGAEYTENRRDYLDKAFFLGQITEDTYNAAIAEDTFINTSYQIEGLINTLLNDTSSDIASGGISVLGDNYKNFKQLENLYTSLPDDSEIKELYATEYDQLYKIFNSAGARKGWISRSKDERDEVKAFKDWLNQTATASYSISGREKEFKESDILDKDIKTLGDYIDASQDNEKLDINKQYRALLKYWDIEKGTLKELTGDEATTEYKEAKQYYELFGADFFTTENGILEFNETAQKISTIQKSSQALKQTQEAALSSELALIYSFTEAYEQMGELEGEEGLLLALEKQRAAAEGMDLSTWRTTLSEDSLTDQDGSVQQILEFYQSLQTTANKELFQSLLTNLGSFGFEELNTILTSNTKLALEEDSSIVKAFKSMYAEQFSGTYRRIAENLVSGLELDSLDEYLKEHKGDTEENYLNYLRDAAKEATKGNGDDSLQSILLNASIEELEQYNKLIEDNKRLAENGTAAQQQVANKRKTELTNAFAALATGKGTIFGIDITDLSKEALAELTALLNAEDIFSYDWGKRIKNFADKYSRITEDIDTLVYENLNTRFEDIISGIDDGIKFIEDFGKKQQDGFEFEEASNIASKLGQDLAEVFKFDKDTGKLVLINFEESLIKYYGTIVEDAKDLKEQYNQLLSNKNGFNDNYKVDAGTHSGTLSKYFSEDFMTANQASYNDEFIRIASYILELNLDQEVIDAAMQYLKEHTDATWGDFIAWAELQGANSQLLLDAAEQAQKTAVRDTNFEEYSKEFKEATRDFIIDQEYFKKYIADETVEDFDAYFEQLREVFDFENKRILDYKKAQDHLIKSGATKKEREDLKILWEEQLASSFSAFEIGEKLDTKGTKEAQMALETLLQQMPQTIEAILADGIISAEESLFILTQNFDSTKDNNLIDTAARIGADFNEIIENMVGLPGQIVTALGGSSALTPEMRDTINEVRNTLYDSITGLLSGTGTWEQATKLQAIAAQKGRNLQFRETADGIQLMNESLGALLLTLQDDNSPLYAQTYSEITKNIQEYYPELEDVFDIQEKILKLEEDKTAENEEQVRLLKAAANYASNTAGSKGFDFMSSSLAGNAENYLTYIENIGNAQNILKEFASSGKIGAGDFMRMMQFAEANNQALPMSWQEIYSAVQTADSEGNISVDVLNKLFDGQDALASIVDLMKKGDEYFRGTQYDIQTDRSNTAEYLSGGKDSIAQNWEDITTGKAPLTVRIDGEKIENINDETASKLESIWKNLTDFEQNEILNTGVWEISTDTTSVIQGAATSLESIDEKLAQLLLAVGIKRVNSENRLETTEQTKANALNDLKLLQEKGITGSALIEAENRLADAEKAHAEALAAYESAKAEFDTLMNTPHTANIVVNKEAFLNSLRSILIGSFPITLSPRFIAIPGEYTGNVSGLALAEGSIEKLQQGAYLANKTLVGELGPELAVYNGQYHMLGQNGAEFVNLPSNAIVFNHKQTEGIVNGQMGIRGKALSDGTVGPALDLGSNTSLELQWILNGALGSSASHDAWGSILGSRSGKGSKTYEFAEQEGEEWYNYLRRIAKLEQEINQLEAERENIADGSAYLRNLRETQTIYQEQLITQKQLLEYQKAQLELERKQIQQKWGDVLTFTDEGLLQYVFGNEVNGGKGILSLLEAFNKMSGAQQVAAVTNSGYSYTDQNGKKLEGEELVQKFLEELTGDYEHYDDLYDSVADTTTELEEFKKAIKDIEDEIRDNRIELEEKIYDLVVDGWEKSIEEMQDELDLLSEANERYINGLSESLQKERDLYDKDSALADREQLQRRLSLLRRSGGAASEIANLEEQLNDTLKDEYFQHQQDAIDEITKASQTQIDKLEQQIRIQEEQLEFSKEHGLIWEDVNAIMAGTSEDILAFIQGNDTSFITESVTQQEKMLEEWAKKIGIFTEDRQREVYTKEAAENFSAETLNSKAFDKADEETKKKYTDQFARYFADARVDGKSADEAYAYAYDELRKLLNGGDGNGTGENGGGSGGTGNNGGGNTGSTSGRVKYDFQGKTYTASSKEEAWTAINLKAKALEEQLIENALRNVVHGGDADELKKAAQGTATSIRQKAKSSIRPYSKGGLVDYTGLAMVHGSKSRPESFLNANQTAMIRDALKNQGESAALSSLRTSIMEIAAAAKTLVSNETRNESSVTIAPGAVVVKVEQLNDKYDIDAVADDIMNKMVSIASRTTNRGVNRR